MKIKTLTALLVSTIFFNCSSYRNPEPEIDTTQSFRKGNGKGLAIGVIDFGNEEPIFEKGGLYYKSILSEGTLFMPPLMPISVKNRALSNPELGIQDKKRFVYLYIIEKKAGKYEFVNFYFGNNYSYSSYSVISKTSFKLPFEIKDGEICYLGEIKINQGSLLGKSNTPPFKIKDNFDLNIKMFKQKYKYLYLEKIENQSITSDQNKTGLFVFE